MPKIIFILLFALLLLLNCTQQDDTKPERIDGNKLQVLVKDALQGNVKSNFKLSGLLISYTPPGEKYNQVAIDSTLTSSGLKLYSVILEFSNPLFNILAVYDEYLNLYLQDNSLSGNIATTWKTISGKQFLVSSDHFTAKDKIELSRLSLYSIEESRLSLVFRTFTRLKNGRKIYEQIINNIGNNSITTRIASAHSKKLNKKTVTFNYSSSDHKYVSQKDIFSNFVLAELKKANWKIKNPELNRETSEEIKRKLREANGQEDENPKNETHEFQISLDSDWMDAVKISVTEHLSKTLKGGIRYINNKLGAQITVVKLPEGGDATQFVKYRFGYPSEGAYSIRSSELVTTDKHIIQIYEHSCANKSYLLILQTPKFTYEKNKSIYSDIVSTFSIKC